MGWTRGFGAVQAAGLGALLALACTGVEVQRRAVAEARPSADVRAGRLACAPLPGAERLWEGPGPRFALVGEVHGTQEIPALVGDVACLASRAGRRVVVALELPPQTADAPLAAYLRSRGTPEDVAALVKPEVWRDGSGRTSQAAVALVERLRLLRAAGARVEVRGFDPVVSPKGTDQAREDAMARTLREAAGEREDVLVLALTGMGHANREGFTSFVPPVRSAAMLLPRERTLSLVLVRAGGSAWFCRPPAPGEPNRCAEQTMVPREPAEPRGIRWEGAASSEFDGVYSTGGRYTASPPAVAPAYTAAP